MSKNAALDGSGRQSTFALLKTDGITLTRLTADPTTAALGTTGNTSGAVTPLGFAATDENGRISMVAVSENDNVTPVALQCDSSGNLLIKHI